MSSVNERCVIGLLDRSEGVIMGTELYQSYQSSLLVLFISTIAFVPTSDAQSSSEVILGNPTETRRACPSYQPVDVTSDTISYPASGHYVCANGIQGWPAANPNPLSISGDLYCFLAFDRVKWHSAHPATLRRKPA